MGRQHGVSRPKRVIGEPEVVGGSSFEKKSSVWKENRFKLSEKGSGGFNILIPVVGVPGCLSHASPHQPFPVFFEMPLAQAQAQAHALTGTVAK